MQFVSPIPFDDAIDLLNDRSVIGSQLSSSEWSDVPVELRLRALFSSRVESVQMLQKMKDLIADFLAGNRLTNDQGETYLSVGSRSAFVDQMQKFMRANGIDRTTGDIEDITSEARLSLIFNTQVRQAQDFGNWKQGMDPDVLDAFPAQRFIRVEDVKEPRQSHEQYQDQVYLKTDPIWIVINQDFGVPWGPWGWGCGHDVEDVDRPYAEKHGLLRPGERLTIPNYNFNSKLGASIKRMDPDLLAKLRDVFGDQIKVDETAGLIRWLGQPVSQVGQTLTRTEKQALMDYSVTHFYDWNVALRSSSGPTSAQLVEVDVLTQALDKLPNYTGTVRRKTDIPADVLAKYIPGNIVSDRGFLSTTYGDLMQDFGDDVELEIVSKTGRVIELHSAAPDQHEVLFDQGTLFKVISRSELGGRIFIELEEL